MPSKTRLTLVFPEGIGLVSKFSTRRLVRVKGSLHDGEMLLELSLKHLRLIREMSAEMGDSHPELFKDAKSQYDDLVGELERLRQAKEAVGLFDILKRLRIRRETREFVEAGEDLLITVKSTSEKMVRATLSRNSIVEDVEVNDIPSNISLRGVAIDVDDSESLDEEIASILTSDPFADPAPMNSPSVTNFNLYIGCVNAENSDVHVIKMTNGGKG